jgi:hypothetical protein
MHAQMNAVLVDILIALQVFVVAFIALHDWIPLGSLNDVRAVQAADSRSRLIVVTIVSTLPFAIGLWATILHAMSGRPRWLSDYLWVSYGLAFLGLIRAWWGPYLLYREPARAVRYQAMFGRTHAFLPVRNGIRPNTLHVVLHLIIVAILAVLALLSLTGGA